MSARTRQRPTPADAWRSGQRGWPASFPLAQLPNLPLLAAAAAWLLAAATDGSVHDYARATFYALFAAWAWGETTNGANWVRRSIGAAGLVYVVVQVGLALGAA